jgi:hypothetical protein
LNSSQKIIKIKILDFWGGVVKIKVFIMPDLQSLEQFLNPHLVSFFNMRHPVLFCFVGQLETLHKKQKSLFRLEEGGLVPDSAKIPEKQKD